MQHSHGIGSTINTTTPTQVTIFSGAAAVSDLNMFPYDFADAVDFRTAYLAGYFADKYDVDTEENESVWQICGVFWEE